VPYPDPYGNPYPQPTGGYGGPAGYGAPQGGYGVPPGVHDSPVPGYGHAPEPYRGAPPHQTSSVFALVVSILLVVTCCGALGVVGLVFSALSMTERNDQEKARRHLRYAWIANGVVLGIMVVLACLAVFSIVASET